MNLSVDALDAAPAGSLAMELVERKGLGHPDTICDALAEEVSRALSRHYLERFGTILHHNVDKALLRGGAARAAFGGGALLAPIELYLAGRVTDTVEGAVVPVEQIAIDASRAWLRAHFHALDAERDVKIQCLFRAGSADLTGLYARGHGVWLANDTSFGAGFAPLTDLERVVLAVERRLNDRATKLACPEIGEDIKVMGVRRQGRISLTIACALIGRFVADLDDYVAKKARVTALALETARALTALDVEANVNVADDTPSSQIYLTVTGTSAEAGDDGEVGRGNRANGLITPYRPMTLEAVAGKNPVAHVGKIYNLVASLAAGDLVRELPGVTEAHCFLVSEIGRPVTDPLAAHVRARGPAPRARVEEILRARLDDLRSLEERLLAGEVSLF